MNNPLNRPHRLDLTIDAKGEFRWRRRAGNHLVVSHGGEGYKEKRFMLHGMKLANPDWESLRIVDSTGKGQDESRSPSP